MNVDHINSRGKVENGVKQDFVYRAAREEACRSLLYPACLFNLLVGQKCQLQYFMYLLPMQRFLASMTVADHPSLEVLLATQLSHRGLEMLEGGVQLLDVPESVSHTARCKKRAPYCLIQL